jgi:hypothetical protein
MRRIFYISVIFNAWLEFFLLDSVNLPLQFRLQIHSNWFHLSTFTLVKVQILLQSLLFWSDPITSHGPNWCVVLLVWKINFNLLTNLFQFLMLQIWTVHKAWEWCNHLVHSLIVNSISELISHTIISSENADDVWNVLKECFAKADRIRISSIRSSINNLNQGAKSVFVSLMKWKNYGKNWAHVVLFLLVHAFINADALQCMML